MRRFTITALGCALALLVISGQVAPAAASDGHAGARAATGLSQPADDPAAPSVAARAPAWPSAGFAAQRDAATGRVLFLKNAASENANSGQAVSGPFQPFTAVLLRSWYDLEGSNREGTPAPAGTLSGAAVAAAHQFVLAHAALFGAQYPAEDLQPMNAEGDALGMTHVRYHQLIGNVPVLGGELIVHVGPDDVVRSMNGRIAAGALPGRTAEELTPTVSEANAIEAATQRWLEGYQMNPKVEDARLMILAPELIGAPELADGASLVWEVRLAGPGCEFARHTYYVDAHDAVLRWDVNEILGTSQREAWDCSYWNTNLGHCVLDVTYNGYRYGRVEGEGPNPNPNPWYSGDPYNAPYESDAAYDLIPLLDGWVWNAFGRDSANARGGMGDYTYAPLTTSKIYTYGNAVPTYQGLCPTAAFDRYRILFCVNVMTYWSNGERFWIYDVAAHEYAHFFALWAHVDQNDRPLGIGYGPESKGLIESQADVFGEMYERYLSGSNDWVFGGSGAWGQPFPWARSLSDPPSGTDPFVGNLRYPDRYRSPNMYCGGVDEGGHHNSTVVSKACYLMAMGGSFNGCPITAIGPDAMWQILYRALNHYYSMSVTFNEAYADLIQAATDLYPPADVAEVTKALQAAEMDQPGYCSGQPGWTPLCRVVGDLDCDGLVMFADINPFVMAIADPVAYAAAYPGCSYLNGDCDGNGYVDFDDINPFIVILSQ